MVCLCVSPSSSHALPLCPCLHCPPTHPCHLPCPPEQVFGTDVNGLPLSLDLSWLEQKAVIILLTLLHLNVKVCWLV